MDRIQLNKRRAELFAAQELMINQAQESKRKLTETEETNFTNATAEINDIDTMLARIEAIEKGKREIAAPTSDIFVPQAASKNGKIVLSAEYNTAFYSSIKHKTLNKFVNAALGEGGTTDGGYLVPTIGPEGQIVPLAPQEASIRQLALVIPTTNDLKLAAQLTKTTAAAKAESRSADHAFTASTPTFTQVTLSAFMNGAFVPVTIELAEDVPALQPFLSADLARGVNNFEENVFVNGSGSGEAEGILTGADAGQTTALTSENSLDMTGTLNAAYYSNAQWLMHRKTGIAFRKQQLTDNQFNPYWVTIGGVDYLHGFKVNYSAAMPVFSASPAVSGKIAFGDFKTAMVIGDRGGPALKVINDNITQLENGVIRVYGYRRTDSRVRVSEAVKVWTING
jgi:HK97 family phage major capsid protein